MHPALWKSATLSLIRISAPLPYFPSPSSSSSSCLSSSHGSQCRTLVYPSVLPQLLWLTTTVTTIGRLLGPYTASAGIGIAITGWSVGGLLASDCKLASCYFTNRTGDFHLSYRLASFYACRAAAASAAFVVMTRLRMDVKQIRKF